MLHDYGTSVSKFQEIIIKSKRRESLKETSIKAIKKLEYFLKLNIKLIYDKFSSITIIIIITIRTIIIITIRTIIIIIELKNLKKIIYNQISIRNLIILQ